MTHGSSSRTHCLSSPLMHVQERESSVKVAPCATVVVRSMAQSRSWRSQSDRTPFLQTHVWTPSSKVARWGTVSPPTSQLLLSAMQLVRMPLLQVQVRTAFSKMSPCGTRSPPTLHGLSRRTQLMRLPSRQRQRWVPLVKMAPCWMSSPPAEQLSSKRSQSVSSPSWQRQVRTLSVKVEPCAMREPWTTQSLGSCRQVSSPLSHEHTASPMGVVSPSRQMTSSL
mmetsp:Transcript_20355/g.51239  ORF Transcript_20355/g.51239 Transcript_20355/m.51239 type:complete len:224 (+) Transcript_20355:1217-1888(+)